jgi:hypothetical protein
MRSDDDGCAAGLTNADQRAFHRVLIKGIAV